MKLKIISWNIWYGKFFDQIVDYLKQADADIVCLQEIVANKDGSLNTSKLLSKELDYKFSTHSFAIEITKEDKKLDWGNAILSKYPINESKTHELSEGAYRRIALEAGVDVHGNELNVITTHLIHTHQQDSAIQNEQADKLIESLPTGSTILAGDFNATPESYPIKNITKVLSNSDNRNEPTFSLYPEGCCPVGLIFKLDYIFISRDIKVDKFIVGESKGSDHLPIYAEIEIQFIQEQ